MWLLPLQGNVLLQITLTITATQNISYKDDILQLKWAKNITWTLQFHIEAHNQNFMLREVKPELNPFGYSCCSSLLEVRILLQSLLHAQIPPITTSKPWLIHIPLVSTLQKGLVYVLESIVRCYQWIQNIQKSLSSLFLSSIWIKTQNVMSF